MKYLLTVICIFISFSLITLFFIWPDQPKSQIDPVITVNGHQFSRETLQEFETQKGYHHENRDDFIESIITKQLLIEEAQRLNIDKEPSFRVSLKNYYEQSLIKVLTERKYKTIQEEVSDLEIDRYINSFGKTFTFTLIKANTPPPLETIQREGKRQSVLFDDLSEPFRQVLVQLNPGETAMAFVTGNEKYGLLLNTVEGKGETPTTLSRKIIAKMLLDHKKEQAINSWINGLRQKASITIHEGKP